MEPVEHLAALLPQANKRAPYLAAFGAMLMVLAPLLALALIPTAQTQERPRTVPPPSRAELEATLRGQITRNNDLVLVRTAIPKNASYVRVLPWPVQWSVGCDGGLMTVTVGAPEPEGNNGILFPSLLTDQDCTAAAISAARILRSILD